MTTYYTTLSPSFQCYMRVLVLYNGAELPLANEVESLPFQNKHRRSLTPKSLYTFSTAVCTVTPVQKEYLGTGYSYTHREWMGRLASEN
jgi:hypothetical protein